MTSPGLAEKYCSFIDPKICKCIFFLLKKVINLHIGKEVCAIISKTHRGITILNGVNGVLDQNYILNIMIKNGVRLHSMIKNILNFWCLNLPRQV